MDDLIKLLHGLIADIDADKESYGGLVINDEAYTAEDIYSYIDLLQK